MARTLRFFAALAICLSGWALVPFTSLHSEEFGWEQFAEAYGDIFLDDFETGDVSRWDRTIPGQGEYEAFNAAWEHAYVLDFRIDPELTRERKGGALPVLAGLARGAEPVFLVEARMRGRGLELKGAMRRDDGSWVETPWRRVGNDYGALQVEWRRAYEGADDGLLYLSVDGRLLAWLVDVDNDGASLSQVGVYAAGERLALVDLSDGPGGRPFAGL